MPPRDVIKAFAVTAAFWSAAAQAQTYPSRPIVMVVPYAAGGTFDVMGRILAARMSELLNQPLIVENTTGAGGIIGVTRATRRPMAIRCCWVAPEPTPITKRSTKSGATTP
jgi:tripartite-type tricarboxylate transporter receptor subunit TctC